MNFNAYLHEQCKIVMLNPPDAGGGTEDYVSLKGFYRWAIFLNCKNATTVTGSAVTLAQATAVAGTGTKALAFTKMWANIDCAAGDTWTETVVTSNTFTTDATNSKLLQYIIEGLSSDLDVDGGFDCLSVGLAAATASVIGATALLFPARYAADQPPSAIIN